MSTRHAPLGSPFNPERFASSAEFERGLLGNLVARRCSVLDDPDARKLIWSVHRLSHQVGLKALTAALLASDKIGTGEMVKLGKKPGQTYTAEQVRRIRKELPEPIRKQFLLRGETREDVDPAAKRAALSIRLREMARDESRFSDAKNERAQRMVDSQNESAIRPTHYPVDRFLSVCRDAAAAELETHIQHLCLDPSIKVKDGEPWYFASLISTLRIHITEWIAGQTAGVVVTEIGLRIIDTLEYTLESRSLTLVEGDARTGKSFAAKSWVDSHPGQARYIEVPTGNDESGFFRTLARGLGLGNFLSYKAIEIRERVESVLLTGDILLVLDEAHRAWPQLTNLRHGFPKRIAWIMSMANQGVPICLVSTPQFLFSMKEKEEKAGFNTAQLQGRLGHYESLPRELSVDDLMAVAKSLVPEADSKTLRALAAYSRTSARYLAAIESIIKRARYIAGRAGRTIETSDVRRAMQESVMPADSKLVRALESNSKPSRNRRANPSSAAITLPSNRTAAAADDLSPEFPQRQTSPIAIST